MFKKPAMALKLAASNGTEAGSGTSEASNGTEAGSGTSGAGNGTEAGSGTSKAGSGTSGAGNGTEACNGMPEAGNATVEFGLEEFISLMKSRNRSNSYSLLLAMIALMEPDSTLGI